MFGSIKRLKNNIGMTDLSARKSKLKNAEYKIDKKFILALIILGAFLIYTFVRAFYDPVMQSQIKRIKLSTFDLGVFMSSMFGYFMIKSRRNK